ncbi:hypothetical protein CAPTEDRAFT_162196 [Capitella teleta]|uniref:Eukaryotic translation initiation factor 3 subunit A n=1 Tax=Capitella teleta TaxID=283909 RepID=R7UBC4_CAPTE|nr:hypothetical protein CAPTEDRAFT_162196 [Capitella teleta]|eukprot:ELU00557.1 hypothetical protein CAPTEDRAFT_162196 [Capitella teleta]
MPTFFQRPENALKRAKEFIDVGKKQRALDALYDVIKSKKHRTWQKIHEPIMETYLTLCVELKKSHIAKEGLYQYKNICQQVNIKSLEDVVRRYLVLAEEKTENSRLESHQAVIDVDDLDCLTTPENLLLSAVSGEDTQDRTDRAILTPWVKFLWESYRQCLDLLRNNSSVEKLYQDIARDAFKFCLKYTRKTEFRKLCDNLRTHLGHIHKHQHQQRAINLNNPESQAMHLDTRLVQLESAIHMELWQEAFKAVEDIHGLIALSKKPPRPSIMANYYTKQALIFWKSGNHMFHACAWHRLFHLSREQRKNLSQEELHRLASRVMCATLAIPIPHTEDQLLQDDNALEKKKRLANLLGMQNPPTRATLVKDLVKYNIIQHVYPELLSLYNHLEADFQPLKLSGIVATPLNFIRTKDELQQYIPALEDTVITRLLKQVSQVYQTISFNRFATLAPFADRYRLERVIVNAARTLDLQVRICHHNNSLSFGTELSHSHDDAPEGPFLQSMPSDVVRNQLISLANVLGKAVELIRPQDLDAKRAELKAVIVNNYLQSARKEHQRILQRRQIIEDRKEELENINVLREREEQEQQEEQRKKQYDAEMARLEREAKEREEQRRKDEHKEIQRKLARERLEQLKNTAVGAKAFADLSEDVIADMDVDDILAKQVEQLEKEKKELQDKLKSQEKKVDYLERAKRLEEIPLLQKEQEKKVEKDKEFWEQQEQERIKNMKLERDVALANRDRLLRMLPDKTSFIEMLTEARMSVHKVNLEAFDKKLNEERKLRMEERKIRRRDERRAKYYKEKEEEEQRRRDEELKKAREEEERKEREEQEKKEEEYRENLRKLEEIEEKKRQREREIEEKLSRGVPPARHDNEEGPGGRAAWRPQPKEQGGWRQRVRARADSWKRPEGEEDPMGEIQEQEMREQERKPDETDAPADRYREDRAPRVERGPRDGSRGDPRDDRRSGDRYDDHGPRDRDDRGPRRDDGPPAETWRGSRGAPREEDRWRGGRGDDRREERRDDDGWRREGPPREERRGPPPREGGSSWRDRGAPRDEPRREERSFRDEPPRRDDRDDWRRGGPPARDDDRSEWRRPRDDGPRDGGDRFAAPRREGGGWRDRAPPPPREGGGWRDRQSRDAPPREDLREERAPREDRGPAPSREKWGRREESGGGGGWRRGGDDRSARDEPPKRAPRQEGDEGWTTVKR